MDFVLVAAPLQPYAATALGAAQIKSVLDRSGLRGKLANIYVDFAHRIGVGLNDFLAGLTSATGVGEVLFSSVLFDREDGYIDDFVTTFLPPEVLTHTVLRGFPVSTNHLLEALVLECDAFVEEHARIIAAEKARAVGFSVTAYNVMSSLALARALSSKAPDIKIVFGGSYFHGRIGKTIFDKFEFIDYLVADEGDVVAPPLFSALSSGKDPGPFPGVWDRRRPDRYTGSSVVPGSVFNDLPYPDYDDYFQRLDRYGLRENCRVTVYLEGSRGCIWGQSGPCRFCGNPYAGQKYRTKDTRRLARELDYLLDRFGPEMICPTDFSLPSPHLREVYANSRSARVFAPLRADASDEDFQHLGRIPNLVVLPGVESFLPKDLEAMNKGVAPLENVRFLKRCSELDLHVVYNLLHPLPKQRGSDVLSHVDIISHLSHLKPPRMLALLFWPFTEYVEDRASWGLEDLVPRHFYSYIYPFDDDTVASLCYEYVSDNYYDAMEGSGQESLSRAIAEWHRRWWRSHLVLTEREDCLAIVDTRFGWKPRIHRLSGIERSIVLACETPVSMDGLQMTTCLSRAEIEVALEWLIQKKLVLKAGQEYLSLAVRATTAYRRAYPHRLHFDQIRASSAAEFVSERVVSQLEANTSLTLRLSWWRHKQCINAALTEKRSRIGFFRDRVAARLVQVFCDRLPKEAP